MVASANQSHGVSASDRGTRLFVVWTLLVVVCQCAGWILSALHALNAAGYAIVFVLFFAGIGIWWKNHPTPFPFSPAKITSRFKRPFPLAFLILASLAVLGGVLYAPNNFDGLVYRTPRVLHWLAESRWHWIHTDYGTLNSRGAGFEWLTAPLFAFSKTDRFEFLINAICFLFLPGRVFATLVRFGVRPRVAYFWMWIYPTAYGFLLQAGSIGNDLFCALWPIAAFEFALRARESKKVEWLWLSVLAAALMTASKAFNLLLLPAWGVTILPALSLTLRRPIGSIAVATAAALSSMIPTALLNSHYCGDWTGVTIEPVFVENPPPVFHFIVNSLLVLTQNFAPPIFPFTGAWDRFVSQIVPTGAAARLTQFFEPDAARFRIPELQAEESAGLGFGVSVLLFLILLRQPFVRLRTRSTNLISHRNFVALAAFGGATIYMIKSGLYAPARYLLPLCFPVIVPILALLSAYELTRRKMWRHAALGIFAIAGLVLIISPARPLWPALTVLRRIDNQSSPLLQRAVSAYSIYRARSDALRPIRQAIPSDSRVVGLISLINPETSLWRPFGSRQVLHIRHNDTPEFTRQRGIKYVVVGPNVMGQIFKTTVEDWAQRNNGEIVRRYSIQLVARGEPSDWVLVRLN